MSSVGSFGLTHYNAAGIRFTTFLETNHLVACSTYFQKNNYTTWRHPRSKLPHQIDHIIVDKSNFFRIIDTHSTKPLLNSAHLAVRCKIWIVVHLQRISPNKRPLTKLDSHQLLKNPELSANFSRTVSEKINNTEIHSSIPTDILLTRCKKLLFPSFRRNPECPLNGSLKINTLGHSGNKYPRTSSLPDLH